MNKRLWGRFTVGKLLTNLALILIVILWTFPTVGLLISSLRDKDQLIVSGWWSALRTTQQQEQGRTAGAEVQEEVDGQYVIRGNLFGEGERKSVRNFATNVNAYARGGANAAADNDAIASDGETLTLNNGNRLSVQRNGDYELVSDEPFEGDRGQRFFYTATIPPTFTFENYREVIASQGIGQAFLNTFTVTVPATIIPIAIAAFAAYAFAWMRFPARQFLFAVVVGLLVVPLQMSLIPLLRMYSAIGNTFDVAAKSYLGIWLAHTGFGLPLAVYLLRNYIGGLPSSLIESAQIDGASHFDIFTRLILPLSIPALASFTIFQFLWVWNDLLVALVFLGKRADQIVLTSKLRELLGSRGDNWEILTSSAFISIAVPLFVFLALQRYFVRGLLAGSVKGG